MIAPLRTIIGASALLLLAAGLSSAQEQPQTPVSVAPSSSPAPLPTKIATMFGQNAIISTQEGQKASAALNAKFGPRRDEFNRKQAELQTLLDQSKKGAATMNEDARNRLNQSIDQKNRDLKRLSEDLQGALQQEEGTLMQQLGEKLMLVVQDYAAKNGYAVVLDVSMPNGPVLWASPRVDITNEIVKMYDKAHPVAPAAPAAPPVKK